MDDEVKGEGNSLNYTFRMHDPRVGRFFAVDPLAISYPYYTPYSFSGNKVIAFGEIEGLEEGWVINGEKIFKMEGPVAGAENAFSTREMAQAAQSVGMKTPSMMDSYMRAMERMRSNPSEPYTRHAQLRDNGLEAQVNKFRQVNPGLAVSRGLIDGVGQAPMVILPEIAFARVGKFYQSWKATKLARKAATKIEGTLQPEFLDDALWMIEAPLELRAAQKISRIDNVLEVASSTKLGRNLKNAGVIRPDNSAAHHIVAGTDKRAALARALLEREGIAINSADNGVFLPQSTKVASPPASTHSTLHTNVYYQNLTNRLQNSSNVRQELKSISKELRSGTFEH